MRTAKKPSKILSSGPCGQLKTQEKYVFSGPCGRLKTLQKYFRRGRRRRRRGRHRRRRCRRRRNFFDFVTLVLHGGVVYRASVIRRA